MWLACHTQDEIADAVGSEKMTVSRILEGCNNLEAFPKSYKLASFDDLETPPIYNVWTFRLNRNFGHAIGQTSSFTILARIGRPILWRMASDGL